jgi:hypothetical protein
LITDLDKAIAELREELERMQDALAALERLAAGGAPRRGRPPKWVARARTLAGKPSKSTAKKQAAKEAGGDVSVTLPSSGQ